MKGHQIIYTEANIRMRTSDEISVRMKIISSLCLQFIQRIKKINDENESPQRSISGTKQ
jgi:hypothetical protein